MPSPAQPDNLLINLLLRRCGFDERAFDSLHGVEAAAWDAVVDHTAAGVLRRVLASLGGGPPVRGELPAPVERLLATLAAARLAGVPDDVLASFTDDALRTALMVWDAFQRGYDIGRGESRAAPSRRAPASRLRVSH